MKSPLSLALVVLAGTLSLAAEPVPHASFLVDPEASIGECLSCHDGSGGRKILDCANSAMCRIYDGHLVGRPYPPKENGKSYAGLDALRSKGLRLASGKITCYTCHNLRLATDSHLPMPHQELCKTCHLY